MYTKNYKSLAAVIVIEMSVWSENRVRNEGKYHQICLFLRLLLYHP